ncbi:NrfD/PsrC family molybdoenzyme membrane anchor subunit [Fibrobacterota bacterium]
MKRLLTVKLALTCFTGFGLAAFVFRFWKGLGPATDLSDYAPWGLWVGLDVMAGIAMAAGALVLAAAVHIFQLQKFRPFLRATILTAFLGYAVEPIGLLLDLGLPWNIWHPFVFWQHQSFLFWVALCVMAYSALLGIEFAPVILEHPLFDLPFLRRIHSRLKKFTLPLIILGIVIATFHQSSLGSLFLIAPFRTHPLWYSPLISVHFLVSAVGLGLAIIIFESSVTSFLYNHKPKAQLLEILGRACSIVLVSYVILRTADLAFHDKFSMIFNNSWQSNLFLLEIGAGALLPALLFNVGIVRRSGTGLLLTSVLVISGFVLNRLNISIITYVRPEHASYFPSLIEIASSLALFSMAFLVFFFFVEHLDLFEGDVHAPPPGKGEISFPGPAKAMNRMSLYTLAFILSASLGAACFHITAKKGNCFQPAPVRKPLEIEYGNIYKINNGNHDIFVEFNHRAHQDTVNEPGSCRECHHRNIAEEEMTPCYLCHKDMYAPASIFNHYAHERAYADSGSCRTCHPAERTAGTFRPCRDCHKAMFPEQLAGYSLNFTASAYMDAMHGQCVECHVREWKKTGMPTPGYCSTCHKDREGEFWRKNYAAIRDSILAGRDTVSLITGADSSAEAR